MQSAKNRLEMAVSPQAKQTSPPEQPDMDSSTHHAELTQGQETRCEVQPKTTWLLVPPKKQGVLGTSVPGEHSSLWATPPPKVRSHQGAVRRWSGRAGRRHRSEWRVWRWGEHLWCPPQRTHSQRSKHRVRARENDSKPTSPWGLGFPQAGGDPHHTLPSPRASSAPRRLNPCP